MTTLIIARHGNTFNAEDTPTRVGAEEVLRICAINPRTTHEDFDQTIAKLEELALRRLNAG